MPSSAPPPPSPAPPPSPRAFRPVRPLRSPVRRLGAALTAGLLTALLAGCGGDPGTGTHRSPGTNAEIGPLKVRYARLAGPPNERSWQRGDDVPLYARIYNTGGEPDRLVEVESPVAESVEFAGGRGGEERAGLTIPADDGVLVLERNDTRVVLRDVEERIRGGDFVPVTLRFERAGTLRVRVHAQAADYDDP